MDPEQAMFPLSEPPPTTEERKYIFPLPPAKFLPCLSLVSIKKIYVLCLKLPLKFLQFLISELHFFMFHESPLLFFPSL